MSIAEEASQVLSQLTSDIKEKFASSQHHQVALQEPWLVAVLSVQTLLFFSVLVMHNNTQYLTAVFVVAMLLVYTSERLNRWLATHWQAFAGQPYFDKNGIFISAVLSAPLVLDMLIILVCYLLNLSKMLVQMKRQEIRHKARQRASSNQNSDIKKTS